MRAVEQQRQGRIEFEEAMNAENIEVETENETAAIAQAMLDQ